MPYSDNMKAKTTIRINKELLTKAQELGINVSKTCEYALKQITSLIESGIWLGRQTHNLESARGAERPEVAGSNPAPGTRRILFCENFYQRGFSCG